MTLALLLPWLLPPALGQAAPQDIWVRAPSPEARAHLRRPDLGFAEGTSGDWIRLHADPSGLTAIKEAGLDWRPSAPPPPGFPAGYHTPSQAIDLLTELATSDLAELIELGESRWGQPIVGLRITANSAPQGQWRVLGTHHGDELPGGEVALAFAQLLIDSYGVDAELTALLERDAVWIVPHINPDGLSQVSRYNAIGVDLNRNYGYQWTESAYRPGERPFSEPESRAVRGLSSWNPFQAGLSLHAGASNLGWVWNYTTTHPPDASLVESMAEAYDDQCAAPDFWITSGADWYITYGDTTDWSYGRRGMLEFTLELSADKTPDYNEIEGIIADHLPSMRAFVLWPHRVTGQVTDASTGRAIPATVARPSGRSQPLVTGIDGRFALSVSQEGSHSVEVYAQGYTSTQLILQTDDDPVLIALGPASLGTARPEPAILSQSGDGTFQLEGDLVWLHRPGE
ncbi:MAG: carboxypeptidase T, partial [Myxococcota bacterium]